MLMAIARHPIISNRNHGNDLPPSWRTLYELSRVPEKKLLAKIADGTINPKIERKDVVALLPPSSACGYRSGACGARTKAEFKLGE
jgi:hypothetical protein